MLHVASFVFNPFQENTYVLHDETGSCAIVDPGCYERGERNELVDYITSNRLTVIMLLNTHCHIDHVLGNAFVKHKYGVSLYLHELEEPLLRSVKSYASNYGFYGYEDSSADGYLKDNQDVTIGKQDLKVIFAPGHSPGHVTFYHQDSKSLIGGDVLFRSSVGRTDLPGGNHDTLINSIHRRIFTLPDDVTVYPGHGPNTSIGYEKKTNPFCALPINKP